MAVAATPRGNYPEIRPTFSARAARLSIGLLVLLATLLGASSAASAAVGLSVAPQFPDTQVGQQNVAATLEIDNTSTAPQDAEAITVDSIALVPSCGSQPISGDCPPGTRDPGVYGLSGTGTGRTGTACAGTTFTISVIDAVQGKYSLTPTSPLTFGPRTGTPAGDSCIVDLTISVAKSPSVDANLAGPGLQTAQLGSVSGTATDTTTGTAVGSDLATVTRAQASIATNASADTTPGGTLSDAATVSGLVNPGAGTVEFRLYGPDDATCGGTPAFTSSSRPLTLNGGSTGGTAQSASFMALATGTYRWRAFYSGDANNAPASGACNAANETALVTPANRAPDAVDDSYSTNEDAALTVSTRAGGVLGNDTDADNDVLTAVAYTSPSNGSLTHNADGTFTYTPNPNYNGTDSFTYKANDGSVDSAAATVTLTVSAVDDPPAAADDSTTVPEDAGPTAIDVLANDTDADGGPKVVESATDPAHGQVSVAPGGSGVAYSPDANYCNDQVGGVPDTFSYTLNGGATATVRVVVTCVAEPLPPPAPIARVVIRHPMTMVRKTGTLIPLRCVGARGTTCKGTLTLKADSRGSRVTNSAAAPAVSFSIAAGHEKKVRLQVPTATRKQLARRHKAVVTATVRLSAGKTVRRLLTVFNR